MITKRKISLALLFMLMATIALAAGPNRISYQGSLTDSGGAAVTDGTYDMRFTIFDDPSAGSLLWYETQADVPVAGGLFSVELGSATALPASIYDTANLYLEIEVDLSGNSTFETNEKYSPRQHITSAAFARNADKVDSLDSAQFLRSDVDDTATSHIIFNDGLSWAEHTSYLSINSSAFVPWEDGYDYEQHTQELYKASGVATAQFWSAPVFLPHGATVTEFTIYFYDSHASDLDVWLRRAIGGSSFSTLAYAASSGTAGEGSNTDTTITNATVDNSDAAYYLYLELPSADTGTGMKFKYAVIKYTTTGP